MGSSYTEGLSSPCSLELCLSVVDGCLGHLALQQEHSFACLGPAEPGQDEESSCVGSERWVCPESSLLSQFQLDRCFQTPFNSWCPQGLAEV